MFDLDIAVGSEIITKPNKALSLSAYASCMNVGNLQKHINMIVKVGKLFKEPGHSRP